jgi:hypothetical protein
MTGPGENLPWARLRPSSHAAQDEGQEEPDGGDDADDGTPVLVGLGHHGRGEHGEDGAVGEGLDKGDHVSRSPVKEEVAEKC